MCQVVVKAEIFGLQKKRQDREMEVAKNENQAGEDCNESVRGITLVRCFGRKDIEVRLRC